MSGGASPVCISLQAWLWTRGELRMGTRTAEPLGVVQERGSAQLGTGVPTVPRDHREPQAGAGRGRRAARQAGDGAEGPPPSSTAVVENRSILEKPRSPARRMGPHPQRDPGRTSTDSRQAFPAGPVVKNLPAQRTGQGSDFCSQKIPRSS